jgi:hypothetical protein
MSVQDQEYSLMLEECQRKGALLVQMQERIEQLEDELYKMRALRGYGEDAYWMLSAGYDWREVERSYADVLARHGERGIEFCESDLIEMLERVGRAAFYVRARTYWGQDHAAAVAEAYTKRRILGKQVGRFWNEGGE